MVGWNSWSAFESQEDTIQSDPLLHDPSFVLQQRDEPDKPVEAVPEFFPIHLLFVLDHIGESEVEVLAVSVDGLVGDAEVLYFGLRVQNGGYKLLALLICPDAA